MEIIKIYLSPQVSIQNSRMLYTFEKDKILIEFNEIRESFDFSDIPDGKLDLLDEDGNETLDPDSVAGFIRSAEKEDGVLYVELLNYIGGDASYEERFPDWIDAKDYVQPEIPKEPVNDTAPPQQPIEEVEPDEDEGTMEE